MLTYFDVIHLATCCHKNQLHNFAVRGYLAITFSGKICPCNMPSVLCRRYPVHNVVLGKPPHTTNLKLFLLFNYTIIIVDHFMYQAYTFFIKYLDFKFCSVISNIVTW